MGLTSVIAAAAAFVGTHFILSHPLRKPLVALLSERGFLAFYSIVALVSLGWLVLAYRSAPISAPLWSVGDGIWAIASALMLLASILLVGSLVGNPAFPSVGAKPPAPRDPHGVFAVTRHPMMWSFALWGMCHIAVFPVLKNLVLALAMIILALAGAALQDRKKETLQPEIWTRWETKTSYTPFVAVATGRTQLQGFSLPVLLGGLALWIGATWAHIPLTGWQAGIWRWL